MADEHGPQADPLTIRLQQTPYQFDFFQAVRRIECAHQDLPPLGHSHRPADDPVRFCQQPSLAFAPSTLSAFQPGGPDRPPRLFVNFLGLLGPNGAMPVCHTEYIRDRERNCADPTLARFMDMFNHRMVSFFYRAWAANSQAVSYEHGRRDRFAVHIGSLFGIGMDSLRNRDSVQDMAKLHYSGRLVCQVKHAEGLRAVLADYFHLPTEIIEFIGRWINIPPQSVCRLGESPESGAIGRTAIVGSRFWDCQQTFRIRFGALTLVEFTRMLPGGTSSRRVVDWVRNYVGDELAFEVQLVLKAEEVPQITLGKLGQLGWTTWLRSRPFERDADDLVLRSLSA